MHHQVEAVVIGEAFRHCVVGPGNLVVGQPQHRPTVGRQSGGDALGRIAGADDQRVSSSHAGQSSLRVSVHSGSRFSM